MANINTTASAGLAEELRTYYDRNLLSRLLPNLIYTLYGEPKPMPQQAGQKVQWRRFLSLPAATTPLTEGVTPDGELLDMEYLEATPIQYGTYLKLTDVVDLQSPDPVLTATGELLGEQAALSIDTLVRDVLYTGTSAQFAGTSNTQTSHIKASDVITTADIRKAVRTLQTNKIKKITEIVNASTGVGTTPIPACYVGIIGPKTHYDLKIESNGGFIPVHKYPSTQALLPFEVGCVDDVRFILSHNAKVFTGAGEDGNDVHATLIFGKGFYGVVQLYGVRNIIKGYGAGDDPLDQRMTTGWKCFFTTKILEELAAVRIEHGVTA